MITCDHLPNGILIGAELPTLAELVKTIMEHIMKNWSDIINASRGKLQKQNRFVIDRRPSHSPRPTRQSSRQTVNRQYYLGIHFPGIYLTRREAECVYHLLKGRTMAAAGECLGLSARTIEFYLKNIKIKLDCRNKAGLIAAIEQSDFWQVIDFDFDNE